ncbi:hypothetical protein LKL35_32365 [Streptomyces sp. ET3-23]|nr:hypothetical protein [Streptomyces sp. ET3-23]MCC2280083.1 hypothetical protein [Streptomyces sp. ET3-23]
MDGAQRPRALVVVGNLAEDTLERRTRVLGEHHPDTLKSKERCRLLQR